MKRKRATAAKPEEKKKTSGSMRPMAVNTEEPVIEEGADGEDLAGGEAALAEFTAEAEAVDERDVKPFSGSATLVVHNVREGIAAVMKERAAIEGDANAPKVDFSRIERCTESAKALAFAARRVEQVVIKRPDLRVKFAASSKIRRVLLKAADALVDAGVFDAAEVASIKAGRGWFDVAQDCADLASLFRRNAAQVRGKTAVTAAQLKEAAALGEELLDALTPTGGRPRGEKAEALAKLTALRDRMAVVVARRYQEVERVAGWRWGRSLGEHVPSMLSRVRSKRAVDDSGDAPKPAPTP